VDYAHTLLQASSIANHVAEVLSNLFAADLSEQCTSVQTAWRLLQDLFALDLVSFRERPPNMSCVTCKVLRPLTPPPPSTRPLRVSSYR